MNLPVTIGGNWPQGIKLRGFNIFDSLKGMSDCSNRIASFWHNWAISENPGHNRFFKSAGRKSVFEDEKYGQKNCKFQLQLNQSNSNHAKLNNSNSIYSNSTNIGLKNQHDQADYLSLHKMMPWGSNIFEIEQASTFSTKTPLAHNNVSLVHTHSSIIVPR